MTGCIIICWRNGSSPRVRGKPELSQKRFGDLRIIPARAGQTASYPRPSNASADHPRACGANFPGHAMSSKSSGSSPRVRGKRLGRTWGGDMFNGSSPRVRGTLGQQQHHHIPERIIPARAGQTCRFSWTGGASADHPRACGANTCHASFASSSPGSSPRVRGKPNAQCRHTASRRIIPARAGQTRRVRYTC